MAKFLDAGIQDVSTSISIEVRKMMKSTKFEERCEDDDESDKHIEARDRRYSCLKYLLSGSMFATLRTPNRLLISLSIPCATPGY